LILKSSLIEGFSILFDDNTEMAYFILGQPVFMFLRSSDH